MLISDRLLIRCEKDALIRISFYEIFAYDDYSSDLAKVSPDRIEHRSILEYVEIVLIFFRKFIPLSLHDRKYPTNSYFQFVTFVLSNFKVIIDY